MKMVNKFGMLVSAFLLATGISYADVSQVKIATVNVQQVLQQSPRVSELSKKLESEFKNRQAKIGEEQKALQDKLEKLKKEAPTMSQKDKDTMQKSISTERSGLVAKVVAYQQDLQKEQNKAMQNILTDLNGIVSEIAKAQSLALVLDSQAVIYAAGEHNDITKDVASKFNAKR